VVALVRAITALARAITALVRATTALRIFSVEVNICKNGVLIFAE